MNNSLKMNNMITEEIKDANPGEIQELPQDLPLEAYQISGTAPIDYKNTNNGKPL